MPFATANRTPLFQVKEVTWGITPATPALVEVRYTGEAVNDSISTEKSKEIRADRMVTDLIVVDSSPAGSINLELSYDSFDGFIESAMMSTWGTQLTVAAISTDTAFLALAAPTANLTSTLNTKFANIAIGQWIRAVGWTASAGANNGYYRVVAKASNQSLSVAPTPAAAETSVGAANTLVGRTIKNGIVEQSYTLVKIFQDSTVVTRHVFTGMRVKGISLELSSGSILTGALNFCGRNADMRTTAFSGETYPAGTTTDVMNCVSNVLNIILDGAPLGDVGALMSMNFELDNQHREQKGLGVLGNVGVVAGQLMVNVTAQQYFESRAQSDRFKASTAFSFSFRLQDTFGNAYIITLPRCKYESFVVNSSQLDSDVMAETSFTALRDPVTSCMIQIDKFVGP